MSKKKIALDMDEVIADVMASYLDVIEKEYGRRLKKEEYWGQKPYKIFPDGMKIRQYLFKEGFFRNFPVMEGAKEGVAFLMEHYDVYITTSATEFRNSLTEKIDWLAEHFPAIHWKKVVLCGDKTILKTDYMIDDHVHNLETFEGTGVLFTATHNIHENRFQRCNNWEEVIAFFKSELEK